jgi:DNA-binding LytR/AlgR family response regulator
MIKRGQQLSFLKIEATAFCYADGKLCYAVDFTGNKFLLENNLSQLEEQLQPAKFYRINRHLLVNIDAINKIHSWLGGRLKLELLPSVNVDTVVSRERVNGFKEWLGQ